ncbi:hypothetical protein HDE_07500 [Halotydeus destructor]|nr:hypothetical protein HDE_07500 [Halotydeus destructor]
MSSTGQLRTSAKATFVGTCTIGGSISESTTLACARDLIRSCSDYLNWTVSIEDNELRMVLEGDTSSDNDSDKERDTLSSSHQEFAQLMRVRPRGGKEPLKASDSVNSHNVINMNSSGSELEDDDLHHHPVKEPQPFCRAETEVLVWECVNEKDTSALHQMYRAIRSRKKLSKIEAIAKAKRQVKLQEERTMSAHLSRDGNLVVHHNGESALKCDKSLSTFKPHNNETAGYKSGQSVACGDRVRQDGHQSVPIRVNSAKGAKVSSKDIIVTYQDLRSASKTHCRQRHPALLLQPIKTSSPTPGKPMMMPKQQQQHHTIMPPAAPAPAPASAYYMPMAYQASESEFDTTRLGRYFSYANTGPALNRAYEGGGSQRRYSRSRSVEAPLGRVRLSTSGTPGAGPASVHSKNAINSMLHMKSQMNQVRPPGGASQGDRGRSLIVTRSESLNSDSSSLSGSGEDYELRGGPLTTCLTLAEPTKSALKKAPSCSSSSSPPLSSSLSQSSQYLNGKKNVTFSAFATIQLMDK